MNFARAQKDGIPPDPKPTGMRPRREKPTKVLAKGRSHHGFGRSQCLALIMSIGQEATVSHKLAIGFCGHHEQNTEKNRKANKYGRGLGPSAF